MEKQNWLGRIFVMVLVTVFLDVQQEQSLLKKEKHRLMTKQP
jgi:hypothetical protein